MQPKNLLALLYGGGSRAEALLVLHYQHVKQVDIEVLYLYLFVPTYPVLLLSDVLHINRIIKIGKIRPASKNLT